MFHIGFLRVVHHLYGRVILYQRQIAVHIVGGFTDRFADKLTRGVVIGFQDLNDFLIFNGQ